MTRDTSNFATQAQRRADFMQMAERRYAKFLNSGETIPWAEMRKYLENKVAGKPAAPPEPRKIGR